MWLAAMIAKNRREAVMGGRSAGRSYFFIVAEAFSYALCRSL
jgi:hypothetical protein